jgi:hypothetical protein
MPCKTPSFGAYQASLLKAPANKHAAIIASFAYYSYFITLLPFLGLIEVTISLATKMKQTK